MSTVSSLIDRVFREYLRRPDDRPITSTLTTSINDTDTALVVADLFTPEEQELLGGGTAIELDQELMTVTEFDPQTSTITVLKRGVLGTTAASHTAGTEVVIAPSVGRMAVYDAISDAIANLYPDLYGVETFRVVPNYNMLAFLPQNARARQVIRAQALVGDEWRDAQATIVSNPEYPGGRAVRVSNADIVDRIYVTCSIEPARPSSEADDVEDLYVDPAWEKILVVDAAASLLHSTDIDNITTEWLTRMIEEEVRPLGSIENLAVAIERYRERLVEKAARRLRADNSAYMYLREVI